MNRSRIILGAIVIASIATAVWWLAKSNWSGGLRSPSARASSSSPESGTPSSPNSEGTSIPTTGSALPAAPHGKPPPAGPDAVAAREAALKASVATAVENVKKLYGYAGALSWDDAKALVARRQQETKAIEDRLAGLGAGGAAAIADGYKTTDDMHSKLMLIHALGAIQDDAADATLQSLLARESSFSLQREIVAALGQRQDPEAVAILSQIAANQADPQLRFAAVQALSGQPSALPVLTQLAQTETNPEVQKQTILAIGAIHNDAAQSELAGIAEGSMDIGIRKTAIQELARVFGGGALSVFQQLLSDPNEAIRDNAVSAVAQVHNSGAVALLQRTASSDSSEQVRASAQAALSSATVQ
ncbi:MAG TPA: HEAT repeat domain-containing protein [Verrucomicrobiae bacterium]|nr:HEAT repeat domain-containing protein [Verrucomicrobiae bacterium]